MEALNVRKIGIGLIAVLILVLFVSGCTNSNNSTGNNSSVQNNSTVQNNNITLQINSDSSWNGTLTYNNGTQTINGAGNTTYNLGQNPGNVRVTLQKKGNKTGTLTLQLIKGSNVIVHQSTTSTQGVVSLSYTS